MDKTILFSICAAALLGGCTMDNKGELSTRMNDIKGIMNRFAGIQSLDLRLIDFFSSPVDNSIDFNRYIDENKILKLTDG